MNDLTTWIVGTLVSAVVALWKMNESKNSKALKTLKEESAEEIKTLKTRADNCEKHRGWLEVQVGILATKAGIELPEPPKPERIEKTSSDA